VHYVSAFQFLHSDKYVESTASKTFLRPAILSTSPTATTHLFYPQEVASVYDPGKAILPLRRHCLTERRVSLLPITFHYGTPSEGVLRALSTTTTVTHLQASLRSLLQLSLVILKLGYNLFFNSLRIYPGPWYCKALRLWYFTQVVRGTLPREHMRLHNEFGDVVQVTPNELSYIGAGAWHSIHGKHKIN